MTNTVGKCPNCGKAGQYQGRTKTVKWGRKTGEFYQYDCVNNRCDTKEFEVQIK